MLTNYTIIILLKCMRELLSDKKQTKCLFTIMQKNENVFRIYTICNFDLFTMEFPLNEESFPSCHHF